MITLIVNNNQTQIICHPRKLIELREKFKDRSPGAFYAKLRMGNRGRAWDGNIYYVNQGGFIQTGLLGEFIRYFEERGWKYRFEDERKLIKFEPLKHNYGNFELRGYQFLAVKALKNNHTSSPRGILFPRGLVQAATNAGKTAIAAGVASALPKSKVIYLINRKEYYEEALSMLSKYLPGQVGHISSKEIKWNRVMVCMVPTINARLVLLTNKLYEFDVVIVDECDLATSKMWKNVLQRFFNAPIRVGLSGTAQVGVLKKDKMKNMQIKAFFGDIVYEIRNADLQAKGVSSKVQIEILPGNQRVKVRGDFEKEYRKGILLNATRNRAICKVVDKHLMGYEKPILVITKNHLHVEKLFSRLTEMYGSNFRIKMVHHKTPDRHKIVKDFAKGQTAVLVASMILARAKNFPMMKVMINAGGGDSVRNALQMLGRAMRTHKSKSITYYYDFFDEGAYLHRHSLHRTRAYKQENLGIIETYKTINK